MTNPIETKKKPIKRRLEFQTASSRINNQARSHLIALLPLKWKEIKDAREVFDWPKFYTCGFQSPTQSNVFSFQLRNVQAGNCSYFLCSFRVFSNGLLKKDLNFIELQKIFRTVMFRTSRIKIGH
jgi:hypothetical protein